MLHTEEQKDTEKTEAKVVSEKNKSESVTSVAVAEEEEEEEEKVRRQEVAER